MNSEIKSEINSEVDKEIARLTGFVKVIFEEALSRGKFISCNRDFVI